MPRRRLVALLTLAAVLVTGAVALAGLGEHDPYPTGGFVYGIAIGDVNRDGKADIVAGNAERSGDHISLLRGRGDGTFRTEKVIADPRGPEGMVLAKLNGDKRKDLAVADYNGGENSKISIFLATKRGGFRLERKLAAGPGAWLLEATDLNRDGQVDLVTGNYGTDGSDAVSVHLGKGKARFQARDDYAGTTANQHGLAVAKFTDDNIPDVAINDADAALTVFKGKANGTLKPRDPVDFSDATPGFGLVAGRLDADGPVELAFPLASTDQVHVLLGNGDGSFTPRVDGPVASPDTGDGIAVAQLDEDPRQDLVVGRAGGGVNLLHNPGGGGLVPVDSFVGGDPATWVETGDLDGDDLIDVVLGTATGVTVLRNIAAP
jgi:hypothetical protein